jgi:hypothetical protein
MNRMRALLFLVPLSLAAQDYYPRHNFTFGIGAGQPRSELKGLFTNSPGISAGYGYRFHRYFQADAGVDTLFGAADVEDYLDTGAGFLKIRDREFFVPLGGRAILPLARGRFLFGGGGGVAYMRYAEVLRQPSEYFRFDCPVCTSRSGWGWYALASATGFLDRDQHFRIGVTSRVFRGHTEGEPLGPVPGVRTRDHWVNVYGEFGFSF